MNYNILSINSTKHSERPVFFTTDRTVGRDNKLLCPILSLDENCFARPHQTHTDRVICVDESFLELDKKVQEERMEGIDAVISNVKGVCLGVSTADCIPVLVYDAEHDAAAAIHAGWRGTVLRIVEKAVAEMQKAYGTDTSKCVAAIGPGISLESFEVGDEVYDAFQEAGFCMDSIARRYRKWHIDIKEANRQQLTSMGIPAESIVLSPIDTFTNGQFFSARREQRGAVKCGRIFSGFVL